MLIIVGHRPTVFAVGPDEIGLDIFLSPIISPTTVLSTSSNGLCTLGNQIKLFSDQHFISGSD